MNEPWFNARQMDGLSSLRLPTNAYIYLKRNCSPSSSWSRGVISNTPVNEKG